MNDPEIMRSALEMLIKTLPDYVREALELARQSEGAVVTSEKKLPSEIFEPIDEKQWRLHPALLEVDIDIFTAIELKINNAISQGSVGEAIEIFQRNGGNLMIFSIGAKRAQKIVDAFPKDVVARNGELRVTEIILAYKSGQFQRGEYLLKEYYGIEYFSLERLLADKSRWSFTEREAFLLISTYRSMSFSKEARQFVDELLGETPLENHFSHGRIYNCLLIEAMHNDQLDRARFYAQRAGYYYKQAHAPYLEFFVHFHLCTIFVLQGETKLASQYLRHVHEALAQSRFETKSEHRMLKLLDAIYAFENGQSKPLVEFVEDDFEKLSLGELWPQLSKLALSYSARAVYEQSGFRAAQELLAFARVNDWHSVRHENYLSLLLVELMQSSGRWMLARDVLGNLQLRIHATWIKTARPEEFGRMKDPLEVDAAIAWMREETWHHPLRQNLYERLQALASNPYISLTQRLKVTIMQAYILRKMGELSEARRLFTYAIDNRVSLFALLSEKNFIDEFMRKSDIRKAIEQSPQLRQTMNSLDALSIRSTRNHMKELTLQENRVLECVAEGASNKEAARELDLSLSTVKFHMTNIMRKLDVSKRDEAALIFQNRAKLVET